MNKNVSQQRERVTARIPIQIRETLEYASALSGATLNQFMIQAAVKEAENVIRNHEEIQKIMLSAHDSQLLWDLIDNPPDPVDKLHQAFLKYQDFLGEKD
jgi:uncharacterized protein (DUF1778 family)